MKTSLAVAAGSIFLLVTGMPLAQEAKAQMSSPGTMAPQAGSSMNMGSAMAQMDEHMQLMKALHEKLMSATTPEARKILLDRQREEMQGCMTMMNQMHGSGMMGGMGGGMKGGMGGEMKGGMGGGMMAQKGKPVDPKGQMQMMEKRMGMMEMMMQTMMDQQGMMAGPQGSTPK